MRGPRTTQDAKNYVQSAKRRITFNASASACSQGVPWSEALAIAERAISKATPKKQELSGAGDSCWWSSIGCRRRTNVKGFFLVDHQYMMLNGPLHNFSMWNRNLRDMTSEDHSTHLHSTSKCQKNSFFTRFSCHTEPIHIEHRALRVAVWVWAHGQWIQTCLDSLDVPYQSAISKDHFKGPFSTVFEIAFKPPHGSSLFKI